ncbi:MAG: hypothetical protein M3362_07560, partial [Acidobacteriota bacterium]|nr:hypothetical protein [Acidobacteriota bacterium]
MRDSDLSGGTQSRNYIEEGVRLLDLTRRANELFLKQEPREKRRLLNFVLSNSTWKDRSLTPEYRQPFDILAITNRTYKSERA